MKSYLNILTFLIIICLSACQTNQNKKEEMVDRAELLFHSVYEGEISNIDSLISDNINASYPIFEEIFKTKVIHGKKAYKDFAIGFNKRWINSKVTIHESISEGDKVVLIWSFSATRVEEESSTKEYSWGGITLFRFDEAGKIKEEVGEESSPGPFHRLQ